MLYAIFTYSDKPHFNENNCQYERMKELEKSIEAITVFDDKCMLLNWSPTTDTFYTKEVSKMLYFWKITSTPKPFSYK